MRPRSRVSGGRGFSLIEMIISLLVLAVVLAAVMGFYVKAQSTLNDQSLSVDLQEDVRHPLAWLGRDIHSAVGVAASWGTLTASSSVLILKIPSVAADGTWVDPEASFDYAVYRLVNGKLQRSFDALAGVSIRSDSSRFLGDNVSRFTAAYLDASGAVLTAGFADAVSVSVSLSASLGGSGRTLREGVGSQFKLRNRPVAPEVAS